MNRVIAWLAGHPVAANLLMAWLVVMGAFALSRTPSEVWPEVELGQVAVAVAYPGAAPEDVESGVVVRIEEAIHGIDGVKRIRSTAAEGRASVIAELELGADGGAVTEEIKSAVDAIAGFPAEIEKPIVREMVGRTKVLDLVVSANTDLFALKALAERVRDDLGALPEIGDAVIVGAPRAEISIEVSESALRSHALTFADVVAAVRRASLDLPGGSVRSDRGEILLRAVGQAHTETDYEDITLRARADGGRLLLGDVATVTDGFAETDLQARFDGEPSVTVSVYRTGDWSALDVSSAVRRYVDEARGGLPAAVSLTVWQDEGEVLGARLSLMMGNGAVGFALVCLMLALFLKLRPALWVVCGIAVSFLGAIGTMPIFDASLNPVSIFAFVLVLGIVVDDAIVVAENVHRHQEKGVDPLSAAVIGTREVARPVVYAVLTSVAAFLPMLAVPGITGQTFRMIPIIAIPCLLLSLVESLGILPHHLAHRRRPRRRERASRWRGVRRACDRGMRWFVGVCYLPALEAALRRRAATVAAAVAMLILTVGAVAGGIVPFNFYPVAEPNYMTVSLEMPLGTPATATSAALARIEEGAASLRRRLAREHGVDQIRHVATIVGDQPIRSSGGSPWGPLEDAAASNVGEITVELVPAETREYSAEELAAMWREAMPPLPEAEDVSFDLAGLGPGDDIDVRLAGPDPDQLLSAAEEVAAGLALHAGVYDVAVSARTGKQEVRLRMRPAAEALGLSLSDVARQVRGGFHGEEIQRIQRGRDDVRVTVRYPRDERRSLGSLERMRIRTPGGGWAPLSQVADLEPGHAYANIARVDRKRAVNVTASVDPAVAPEGPVLDDLERRILPEALARHPGVAYSFEGAQAEQAEATAGLLQGFALAMLLIFTLLAVCLRSYVQPVIIMAAIPFGFVGAIWGHVVMGVDLTMVSMFGLVALSGVVVNDSLVMVDFINGQAEAGAGADHGKPRSRRRRDAIRAAGRLRFRPILLTSLTTFAGLAPLMFDGSMHAKFLVPMAVSLAFGVLFATFITLILVPTAYTIVDDARRWMNRLIAHG